MDDFIDTVILTILAIVALGLILLLGYVVYQYVVADKLILVASNWECTQYKQEAPLYMQSGKVFIPIDSKSCISYKYKGN